MSPPTDGHWFWICNAAAERAGEVGPAAWIVYSLLCRHADDQSRLCNPGLAYLVSKTGLKRRTVQYAIRRLEAAGWLVVDRVTGKGNRYRLPPIEPLQGRAPVHEDAPGGCTSVHETGASTCTGPVHVGAPKEDIKKKTKGRRPTFDPTKVPLPFQSKAFCQRWEDFCEHRRTLKPKPAPISELAAKRLLSKCQEWGEAAAIEAIDDSIASGWKGIFEPKPNGNRQAMPAEPITYRDPDR